VSVQVALMRVWMRQLLSSQRYVVALVALVAIPAVTVPSGGALPDDYGLASLLVPSITAFLAVQTTNVGSNGTRSVLFVAAGGRGPVMTAHASLTAVSSLAAAAFLAVGPLVVAPRAFDTGQVVTGFTCIVAAALTGSAIGVLGSRYVFRSSGWSFVFILLALLASVRVPSPVREALDVLQHHPESLVRGLAAALHATCLLLVAAALAIVVARRRDNL